MGPNHGHQFQVTVHLFSGTIFVYCVVPETKGKSCEEIRSLFATTETPSRSKEVFDFNNNPDDDCKEKQQTNLNCQMHQ